MYLLTYLLTYCGVLVRAKYQLDRYYYSAPDNGARSIVMSVSVYVCVCLSAIISPELHVRSSRIFYARYLWPWLGPPLTRSDVLRVSCFVDDVIFAVKLIG